MTVRGIPFDTVLVANRGEIAVRIGATLRRLGIRAAAVYTDADRGAVHVAAADVALRLDPRPGVVGYLDVDAVLRAARSSGADAVHPGYGFLAESPELARACAAAGVVLIGPGADTLAALGDKLRAKRHAEAAGVPVIPGVACAGLEDGEIAAAAATLGYPVVVKPAAGGGGKGIAVVRRAAELQAALDGSRRVAKAAFGDDALLLERHVPAPRHLEVQLLADAHGAVLQLGERECSLQRRHQKVIEEAPSPLLGTTGAGAGSGAGAGVRERLGDAACAVARSVGYLGAGTVEFLVPDGDPGGFRFVEMNPRLQVEHPVTELVTGLDLVEWQLRIAAGERLPFAQSDVLVSGHAVEARVYAEDPGSGFLPATGVVRGLREPSGDGVRVDSALQVGLRVGTEYDPMLAKVVAWGADRAAALHRLDAALSRTAVVGVRTNLGFLRDVLAEDDVRAGRLDTGLLGRLLERKAHDRDDTPPDAPGDGSAGGVSSRSWTALVAAVLHRHGASWREAAQAWRPDGWRMGGARMGGAGSDGGRPTRYELVDVRGRAVGAAVLGPADDAVVIVGDDPAVPARLIHGGIDGVALETGGASLEVGGVVRPVCIAAGRLETGERVTWVTVDGFGYEFRFRSRLDRLADELSARGPGTRRADPAVRAPLPGIVVAVEAADGEQVTAGAPLLTLEAMKLEHRLVTPHDGVVSIAVRAGDRVALDQVVATVTPRISTPDDERSR